MFNPALEPGQPEILLPGVVAWNPDQTLERLGRVSHVARAPLEASGPITQFDKRYPKKQLRRPPGPASPGVSP